jgi:hypothetical protein
VAASVSNIPQMHCVGFDDKVIPKQLAWALQHNKKIVVVL